MSSSRSTSEAGLLKAILEESATEVLVFDANTLNIVQANPSALKNLQYRLKAIQSLTPLECLVVDDARAFNTLLSLLRKGKLRRSALNVHFLRRDGSRYPVEARVFYAKEHGKRVFICVANDVSQREATRQALAHSESDLRAIIAHIPGMTYQVFRTRDGSTSLRYVSEQSLQLLGIKASALLIQPERFFNAIVDEDKPGYLARLANANGSHMTFDWEGRIRIKTWGDVKWVNIRVSQRETPNGRIWDGIMLNITQSKKAEEEIRQSREALSALAAHVESVKERERLHLAREVHDDLGGNLTAIKIGLSWLQQRLPEAEDKLSERTAYLDKVVDQTIEAAHRIASNLRPAILELGIVSAIDWQLQQFSSNTDITYTFRTPEMSRQLDADTAIAVFRIVQEALTNIAKHAHASQVKVDLMLREDDLRLDIADNGRGIQPVRNPQADHGFGVLGMKERAAALGGELSLKPVQDQGTLLSLRIPLSRLPTDAITA